jgi:hypothetical protein
MEGTIIPKVIGAYAQAKRRLQFFGIFLIAGVLAVFAGNEAVASGDGQGQRSGIGYGGPRIQLHPIMVPYRTPKGIHYEPLTVRLVLPGSDKSDDQGTKRQRIACYSIPMVHEHLLFFLYRAGLSSRDFVGPRRKILAERLLKAVTEKVGSGIYADIELVDLDSAPLSPTSRTLSTQCR